MKRKFSLIAVLIMPLLTILLIKCSKQTSDKENAVVEEILAPAGGGGSDPDQYHLARLLTTRKFDSLVDMIDPYGYIDTSAVSIVYYDDDTSKPWFSFPVMNQQQFGRFHPYRKSQGS